MSGHLTMTNLTDPILALALTLLAIAHYKTINITVRGCVVTGCPEGLRTEDDLRHFLQRWGWYAKDFRVEDNRFFEESL